MLYITTEEKNNPVKSWAAVMHTAFSRWSIGDEDLKDLAPVRARALIFTCFYEAQRETFALGRVSIHER